MPPRRVPIRTLLTRLALGGLTAMCGATTASAQHAPAAAGAAGDVGAAGATLRHRQLVRVHTSDGARVYGRLLARTTDSLMLSAPRLPWQRTIAWAAVDTLWVQRGTAAVPVGLAGAAVFGTAVGYLGHVVSGGDFGPLCRRTCVVSGALAGAGVGFVIGAAFGSLVPRWRQRFPVREQARR